MKREAIKEVWFIEVERVRGRQRSLQLSVKVSAILLLFPSKTHSNSSSPLISSSSTTLPPGPPRSLTLIGCIEGGSASARPRRHGNRGSGGSCREHLCSPPPSQSHNPTLLLFLLHLSIPVYCLFSLSDTQTLTHTLSPSHTL